MQSKNGKTLARGKISSILEKCIYITCIRLNLKTVKIIALEALGCAICQVVFFQHVDVEPSVLFSSVIRYEVSFFKSKSESASATSSLGYSILIGPLLYIRQQNSCHVQNVPSLDREVSPLRINKSSIAIRIGLSRFAHGQRLAHGSWKNHKS